MQEKFDRHFEEKLNLVGEKITWVIQLRDSTGKPDDLGWYTALLRKRTNSKWHKGLAALECTYRYKGYVHFSQKKLKAIASYGNNEAAIYVNHLNTSVQNWRAQNNNVQVDWDIIYFNIVAHEMMFHGAYGGVLGNTPFEWLGSYDNIFTSKKGDIDNTRGNIDKLPTGMTEFINALYIKILDAHYDIDVPAF